MKEKMTFKRIGMLAAAVALIAFGYWWGRSGGHDVQANPPGGHSMAGMEEAASASTDGSVTVSPERQQLIGMRTAVVENRAVAKKIRTVGIVAYDETKVASVYAKVEGWIERLFVDYTGKLVGKGQPLFALYSPDLVSTQEEYLLALSAKDSLASSSIKEIRTGSLSLLDSARRRLHLWDIADKEIEEI